MSLFSPKQHEALIAFTAASEGSPERYHQGVLNAIRQAKLKGREATETDILDAIRSLTTAAKLKGAAAAPTVSTPDC